MEGDAAWDAAPSLKLGRAGNRQEFDSALLPPILYHEDTPVTNRKRRLKPYNAVEYKGLKPGDAAIAVTTCTSRGQLRVGRYLGLRGGNVVMEVHDKRTLLVDANDVPYDWAAERREVPSPWDTAPKMPESGMRWGSPEYKSAVAKHQAEYKIWRDTVYAEYQQKLKDRKVGYSEKEFWYTWVTQLQNNKIYPAGIALVDVTL